MSLMNLTYSRTFSWLIPPRVADEGAGFCYKHSSSLSSFFFKKPHVCWFAKHCSEASEFPVGGKSVYSTTRNISSLLGQYRVFLLVSKYSGITKLPPSSSLSQSVDMYRSTSRSGVCCVNSTFSEYIMLSIAL